VLLKGEENYIKYYTCSEIMINPGQVLFASLPMMPGKVVLQLPIELYGRFNTVISRDTTPCIVNLRRPSTAKMALILPRGTLILEQALIDNEQCDYNSISAKQVLLEILSRQE
jgi:hypothetical protein